MVRTRSRIIGILNIYHGVGVLILKREGRCRPDLADGIKSFFEIDVGQNGRVPVCSVDDLSFEIFEPIICIFLNFIYHIEEKSHSPDPDDDQDKYRKMFDRLIEERSEEHTSELQSRGHLVC